jgi:nucleoside-diphosphate-sugar epimerase
MKVFVAGATGAIGKQLVPQLLAKGYDVTGTTRSPEKANRLRVLGAQAVIVDGLDQPGIMRAVTEAKPDVIIHEETALSSFKNPKHFDTEFAKTNQLRTTGLDNVLKAARAAGSRRVVAQSFTGWPNQRTGGPIKSEDDPLDSNPPAQMTQSIAAIRSLEGAVTNAADFDGLALRYGSLYGAGTSFGPGGEYPAQIRKRALPLIGDGSGIWSFIHVADAAAATVAAVERGAPGVYNIVDDDPAPVLAWLPYLADLLGAKPPRHLPVWLARLFVGDAGTSLMTQIRGSSNARAKRDLGWQPAHPSWREGFRETFATNATPATKPLTRQPA